MKKKKVSLIAGALLTAAFASQSFGAEIIGDNYDVTGSGTGFNLNKGVNSGINPPTTRLTGSAAANLRYVKVFGPKADSAHTITDNKLSIARISSDSSTLALSTGTGAYDFGTDLNTLAASPAVPAVYEMTITFANAAAGSQRCSFALSSAAGTAGTWDFGLQLYHPSGSGYTLQKRISANAAGSAVNSSIATDVGTYPEEVSFLIRVTDAGAEDAPGQNTRIQVSIDGGANWIYDTSTDVDLPSGFRFASPSRFIFWDIAGGAGPVTYDNFSLNYISGPVASDRIWTGAGSDDNWSTAANWGGNIPVTGDSLIFNGTTRQANVNDLADFTTPLVAFNNGGFNLSGNLFNISGTITNASGTNTFSGELAFDSTAVKTWAIAADSEVVLNNNTSVEVGGDHTIVGGGVLRVKGTMNIGQATTANPAFVVNEGKHIVDAGSFVSRGGYRIGSLKTGIGAETILTNNAMFNLTVSGGNLRVGDANNPVASRLTVDHSTLLMLGGSMGVPYAANAIGEVVQNGGVVSGGIIAFNDAGAGTGTYTIQDGGVLEPIQIRKDTAGGSSSIFFNNAILRSSGIANAADFFSGVDVAEIQAGGLALDAQNDVTIGQVLSGTGTLTKSNYATVTLTGANTYSGNTLIQSGKLVLPNVQTNTTTVQVADGAELGVLAQNRNSTLSVNAVNFTGTSYSTLNFDLGNFTTPNVPMMKVSNLSVSGPVVINIANGLQLTTGQFALVDYDGSIAGGYQFTLGSLPSGVSASLINNTANGSIDLKITGVPGYRWTGAINGDWDSSTQNWIDLQNNNPSTFVDGFPALFPDGATTGNVNITGFPMPTIISVSNNALPYVFSNGALTTDKIKKSGTNTATRVENAADFVTEIEINDGTFAVSNVFDSTVTSILTDTSSGTGTFAKQGASVMTLSSTNDTYDGAIRVQEGTLKLAASDALGTTNGATIIDDGATLDLNNLVAPHEPVIVSGAGVNGQGAIIDSTTATGVAANLTDVTLAGDTTLGSPNGGRWDLRVRTGTGPDTGLKGNGFNLTKVGPGAVSIACQRHFDEATQPFWDMNLGDVTISEGTLTFAESLNPGNPAKNITIADGATLGTYDLNATNPILRNIYMGNSAISSGGGVGGTNMFNGTISVTGAAEFRPSDADMVVNGPITGAGSLVVNGSGVGKLYLNGNNTLTGDTTVTSGGLGGIGTITANLILSGELAPGYINVGTLTVNGNVTLGPTTTIRLDRSQSPNSDRLAVGGTLSGSSTLNVVLAAGAPAPQAGDVYQLFNKGTGGAFTTVNLPDLSALPGGLAWDTSNLSVNGTIAVTGTATPPTIDNVSASGGNFVFSGTGGVEGADYVVLSSTNVALPIGNWTPVVTNTFGPGGSFSYTNAINPETPETFFLLQVP